MKNHYSFRDRMKKFITELDGTLEQKKLSDAVDVGDVEALCNLVQNSICEDIRLSAASALAALYKESGESGFRERLQRLDGTVLKEHSDYLWDGERVIKSQPYPPDLLPPIEEREKTGGHVDEAAVLFDSGGLAVQIEPTYTQLHEDAVYGAPGARSHSDEIYMGRKPLDNPKDQ